MTPRLRVRELLAGARGARLCYGKAVRVGDLSVIPVARVWFAGGGGWGQNGAQDSGGGGGGVLEATPIGYIEVTGEGSRYVPIRDFERAMRGLRSAATAVGALAAATGAVRAVRGPHGRSSRRLLGRGR